MFKGGELMFMGRGHMFKDCEYKIPRGENYFPIGAKYFFVVDKIKITSYFSCIIHNLIVPLHPLNSSRSAYRT